MSPLLLESHVLLAAACALALYAAMLAVAALLLRLPSVGAAVTPLSGRYGTLDGFRGVLAAGVFIHHAFTAFVYFTQGRWDWSHSALLNHLGQTTVALFFMITGFLFTLKAVSPRVDWRGFFLSRMARLFPLYAVVIGLMFVLVFHLSGWQLREPVGVVLKELVQWLAFVCFGRPDVNGLPMTWTLIAGVNWSLRYEVFFYIVAVPLLNLLARLLPARALLVGAAVALVALLVLRGSGRVASPHLLYVAHFVCGILVAAAYREPALQAAMRGRALRLASVVALGVLLSQLNGYGNASILAATVLFAAVVGGMPLFGVLHTRAALWLGDISYGIYLLHGMVLWLVLSWLQGRGLLAGMSLPGWLLLMAGVGAAVVGLASLSYVRMERPIMGWASRRARARRMPVPAVTA